MTRHAAERLRLPALPRPLEQVGVDGRDLAVLFLRVTLGVIFVAHGAEKLFGSFGGLGLSGTAAWFESVGLEPGKPLAIMSGLAEFGGGIAILLGALTRLAGLALAVNMCVAIASYNIHHGFFATDGRQGYEFPLVLGVVALALVFLGGGAISVDRVLSRVFYTRPTSGATSGEPLNTR